MKETLLTVNAVWLLVGGTFYVGVLTTLRLFLYPSWTSLNLETAHAHFTLPTEAATRFFLRAIPTWIFANIVLIVAEWGEPTVIPAIISFLGLMTTTLVGWFGIQPINRRIKAGAEDMAELTDLLKRWMRLNDLRWAAVIVMYGALVWYFVWKPDLPGALG